MARAAYLGKKAEVNVELDGLEIGVNQFGEISSNLSVDEMNSFLNKSVFDKKLKNNCQNNCERKKLEDTDQDSVESSTRDGVPRKCLLSQRCFPREVSTFTTLFSVGIHDS